jgi:phosphomannomutase
MRRKRELLSELIKPLQRYYKSPEINFEVADKQGKMDELARHFAGAEIDYLDGITISYPDWWANVRPSNTEPFLRLVLEAKTTQELERRKAELFGILGHPAE